MIVPIPPRLLASLPNARRIGRSIPRRVVTVAGLFLWLSLLRIVPARITASVQFLQPIFHIASASGMFGNGLDRRLCRCALGSRQN